MIKNQFILFYTLLQTFLLPLLKFIYSEKATKFCEIFTLHAVSDYKNQSYKNRRWIFGKI